MASDWVVTGLMVVFPIEADASSLPDRKVVEDDSMLEKKFVLEGTFS